MERYLTTIFFVLLTRKDVEQTYNKILVLLQLKKDKVFYKNAYFIQIMYITLIKNYLTYIGNVPWVTISILRMMNKSGTAAVTVQLFHSIKLIRGLY